jgi:hypothetical protein
MMLDRFFDVRDKESGVEINKQGVVALRSAKVTAVSGNTITVTETLGAVVLTWTVTTDAATLLQAKNGATITMANIVVGDIVTIKGVFQSGNTLSVKATLVRDISRIPAVLTQVPGSATPTSLVMTIGGVAQTVTISPTTVVLNSAWTPVALSTFLANDVVRVFGYVPTGSTTITGIVLRNTSR